MIPRKNRRIIVKGLVTLGYINSKVTTDELIENLYKIKDKIQKHLVKKVPNKVKIVETEDKLLFKRTSIKQKSNKPVIIHTPVKKDTLKCKKSTEKKIIKNEKIKNNIEKSGDIYIKQNYKQGNLDKYLSINYINNIFSGLQQFKK